MDTTVVNSLSDFQTLLGLHCLLGTSSIAGRSEFEGWRTTAPLDMTYVGMPILPTAAPLTPTTAPLSPTTAPLYMP